MSNTEDFAEPTPDGGVPEWQKPIEYNEGLEDDDEGPPEDLPGRRSSCVQSQPSTRHPRSGKPTSNYITYIDLMHNPARFDLDRLKTWPPSGGDCWHGRGEREGKTLCRVPPARGGTTRWVLIYPVFDEGEVNVFTLAELESLAFGRNYRDDPVDRELTPREAAEWLERNEYELPDDLEPAPPFDASKPHVQGRLRRDWRPVQAPDGGPPEPAKKEWRPRVVLRGPGNHPLIDGGRKEILTKAQYDVILALQEAGESGLDKNSLVQKSKHGSAVKILKNLACQDIDWGSAILLPGKKGRGYRLAPV